MAGKYLDDDGLSYFMTNFLNNIRGEYGSIYPNLQDWVNEAFLPLSDNTSEADVGKITCHKTSYNYNNGAIPGTKLVGHHTIENLIEEVRFSNGQFGSILLQTSYTKNGITIPTGWYNYEYIPHGHGGIDGSADPNNADYAKYGNLILYGMSTDRGIEYKISINGSGDTYTVYNLVAPQVYSSAEQIIGKWIDGSTIYRKVLTGTPSAQNSNVQHGITNLATPIKCYGFYKRNSDRCLEPMPGNYTNWECWMYDFNSTKFTLRFSNNAWNSGIASYIIVLEYIKTGS